MRNPLRLLLPVLGWIGILVQTGGSAQLPGMRQGTPPLLPSAQLLLMVEEWGAAVARHEPGMRDQAVEEVGSWPIPLAQRVIRQVVMLAKLLVSSRAAARALGIQHLLGLTDDELQRGNANRILKRGALLHTDIAILAPAAARLIRGSMRSQQDSIRK